MAPSDDARWLIDLLIAAGRIALDHAAAGMVIRRKADDTVVTDADVAAEAMIVAGLRDRFPGDAIHGEEAGGSRGAIGWAVDPIDGTSAYTEGLAYWGPTVARFTSAPFSVLLGALVLPRTGELFVVEGGFAWADGLPLGPISDRTSQDVCYVPSRFHRRGRLDFAGKTRCLGGTAAHLALVARGSARAAIVAPGWSIWDTAAGLALIEAAGGVALRLPDGAPLDPLADEGAPFVAGTIETAHRLAQPGRLTVHPPREHSS